MPGQISDLTGQIRPGGIEFDPPLKLGGNHWDDTQFDQGGIQCNLNEFPPNLTSISCLVEFEIRPVKLGVNPLR